MGEFVQIGLAQLAPTFIDRTVASLSSGQAAGTASVIAANTARLSLILRAEKDCAIAFESGAAAGVISLYAGLPRTLTGADCPANALYVLGLATADRLIIKEATSA